jgi:pimeloyl-ACP methyl ester carboxylesterase
MTTLVLVALLVAALLVLVSGVVLVVTAFRHPIALARRLSLPLPLAERTAAQLRDARLHVIRGGGHILHRDRAREFADVLGRVLASRGTA